MANGPIQVVLNSDSYIQDVPPRQTPIKKTDFYVNNDALFAEHKNTIVSQLQSIGTSINQNAYSKIGYVKVRLIPKALAKSHRPTKTIFTQRNQCKLVGGAHRGELLIELNGNAASSLATSIVNKTEIETNWQFKNGRQEPAPSPWRSELGAIASVSLYNENDKCSVSDHDLSQWLSDDGNTIYTYLFAMPTPENAWDTLDQETRNLYSSFKTGLSSIEGVRVSRSYIESGLPILVIKISDESNSIISFQHTQLQREEQPYCNLDRYQKLLSFLKSHPLVRYVQLAPSLNKLLTPTFSVDHTETYNVPSPLDAEQYPSVGVVDGGISDIYADWKRDSWNNIMIRMRNTSHGTFIAGLLIHGAALNPNLCKEADGCNIVDACLFPDFNPQYNYMSRIYSSMDDFFHELETAITDLSIQTGTRIFNVSINIQKNRKANEYSQFAMILDNIAMKTDVIFVISAGNLCPNDIRTEWTDNPNTNIQELTSRPQDVITAPAESIRNISVGALNPDAVGLASYSRRGKGSMTMIKPDVVYPSGSGECLPLIGHGLYSLDERRNIYSSAGTSFAAPIVAKTLACIDKAINGYVSRETLMAILLHNSHIPEELQKAEYKPYLKDLIGYGMPISSQDMLNGNEHSITLVFAARIQKRKILSFGFEWPQSLITDGKCRGKVKLTLVSTPHVDYNFEDEMIRENVHVSLRMMDENGHKKSQLQYLYKDATISSSHPYEWELVESEMKWNPIKILEGNFNRKQNKGTWYLDVEYESRTDEVFTREGVPFTAILTIEDPQQIASVYNDMKLTLQAQGTQIADIQTAITIAQRI